MSAIKLNFPTVESIELISQAPGKHRQDIVKDLVSHGVKYEAVKTLKAVDCVKMLLTYVSM